MILGMSLGGGWPAICSPTHAGTPDHARYFGNLSLQEFEIRPPLPWMASDGHWVTRIGW